MKMGKKDKSSYMLDNKIAMLDNKIHSNEPKKKEINSDFKYTTMLHYGGNKIFFS